MAWEDFKKKLEEEKAKLEADLSEVARKNPEKPGEWEIKAPEMNPMLSDQSELADTFEELETRAEVEFELEERYKHIVEALERIGNGTYGICKECGNPIEEKRLEANPAAKTCIKHKQN